MNESITFTAKQVGERVKERRTELNLSMGDLGNRLGVNKSTIQRYESKGVEPEKRYLIVSLADALLTTPEWLTGLSEEKEYDGYVKSKMKLDEHLEGFLKEMDSVVGSEAYQQFLAGHLCNIIDLYSVYTVHFARAMKKVNEVTTDEGLKESLMRYAIESGAIVEQVYQKEMEPIIEDMKHYMDGLLHIYDKGKSGKLTGEMFRLPLDARNRLDENKN
ncbi:MAG: helix-turn-helix transcriptional regulator [Oscillospiraceae bacterium]|nr:helix-turn-helix transcriptional regulator [Oscillospiraceae bacterium]